MVAGSVWPRAFGALRSACQHVLVVGIVFRHFGLSSDVHLFLASGQSGRCPVNQFAGRPEGMGKKGNKSSNPVAEPQYRRKPWQLGSNWEVYPEDVPPYEPWTPLIPIERLEFTLDGLRQGELDLQTVGHVFQSSRGRLACQRRDAEGPGNPNS